MKKIFLYTLIAVLLVSACNSSKPKLDKVQPNMSRLSQNNRQTENKDNKNLDKKDDTPKPQSGRVSLKQNTNQKTNHLPDSRTKVSNQNNAETKQQDKKAIEKKQPTKEDKQQQKEKQKELKKQKKEADKTKKANDKKKKSADKEKRKKEKQQDELIKNAAKEERKRIEEERKKEKENLLNTIKENKDNPQNDDDKETENTNKTVLVDTVSTQNQENKTLEEILGSNNTDNSSIVKDNIQEEDNTPAFLKKFKKKKSPKNTTGNVDNATSASEVTTQDSAFLQEKEMTTMDKILYMMDAKNQALNPIDSTKPQKDALRYYNEPKQENFIKKTWHKIFPKKIDRDITYNKIYSEEPKNILILYPWNRSDYDKADEMLYIMATKELGKKGYYVYSAIEGMEKHKKDSTFSSHYIKIADLKNIREQYSADAVMFITIFRFDNPYWSTATKAVAHYTLVSTKTFDTLFARQFEFNYDTPIPPKEYHNKDLELDNEQVYDLGVMEQMQIYALWDIPYGPYHKKYKKDQKKNSNKQEVKYKISVRPS